jgi:hypothetical protein
MQLQIVSFDGGCKHASTLLGVDDKTVLGWLMPKWRLIRVSNA